MNKLEETYASLCTCVVAGKGRISGYMDKVRQEQICIDKQALEAMYGRFEKDIQLLEDCMKELGYDHVQVSDRTPVECEGFEAHFEERVILGRTITDIQVRIQDATKAEATCQMLEERFYEHPGPDTAKLFELAQHVRVSIRSERKRRITV